MKITIRETGEQKELEIIDEQTGCEWTNDLIGNHGGLSDGQIEFDSATGAYLASQETFNWWEKMIGDYAGMESSIASHKKMYGGDLVDEWLDTAHAFDRDLEDIPKSVAKALEDGKVLHDAVFEGLRNADTWLGGAVIVKNGEGYDAIPGAYLTDASYTGSCEAVYEIENSRDCLGVYASDCSDYEIRKAITLNILPALR